MRILSAHKKSFKHYTIRDIFLIDMFIFNIIINLLSVWILQYFC